MYACEVIDAGTRLSYYVQGKSWVGLLPAYYQKNLVDHASSSRSYLFWEVRYSKLSRSETSLHIEIEVLLLAAYQAHYPSAQACFGALNMAFQNFLVDFHWSFEPREWYPP